MANETAGSGDAVTKGLLTQAVPEAEADAGADAFTSYPSASSAPVICAHCGHENSPGTDLCIRPGCRKALKGNSLARKIGLYAKTRTPETEAIERAGRQLFEQSVLDAGGRDELIARELADHEYRALLHANVLKIALALDTHGHFDGRGRLRKNWIELLDRLISSAVAIDKTLGLSRRSKRVPTLAEVMRDTEGRDE